MIEKNRRLKSDIGTLQHRIKTQRRRISHLEKQIDSYAKEQNKGPLWIKYREFVRRALAEKDTRIAELEAQLQDTTDAKA